MYNLKINPSTKVNPLARERFYPGSEKTAVLLFHGWTGYPYNLEYLGQRIHQETGFTIYIPRLPGHGTNTQDFLASGAKDWLRKSYDSYLNLAQEYPRMIIGGLSMGGLLSIILAANFKVDKLLLIAPALYARSHTLPLAHILRYFLPALKRAPEKIPKDEDLKCPEEKIQRDNYWRHHYLGPAAELHKLMFLARKRLTAVTSDTIVIASKTDESVPLKAVHEIENKIKAKKKKIHIFDSSPHVITTGPYKEECAQLIIDFIK